MSLVGGFVRGFAGFGGPAVMLLVLTPFFNPLSLLSKVMVIDLVANLKLLPNSFADVDWKLCLTVSGATLIGVLGGTYALLNVEAEIIKTAVALVVALCTLVMLTGWRYQRQPGLLAQVVAGLVAGFVLGAIIAVPSLRLPKPYLALLTRAFLIGWKAVW